MFIGVLLRFWLKIEGTGLDGPYSIYQGHLFFQKDTYAQVGTVGCVSALFVGCSKTAILFLLLSLKTKNRQGYRASAKTDPFGIAHRPNPGADALT